MVPIRRVPPMLAVLVLVASACSSGNSSPSGNGDRHEGAARGGRGGLRRGSVTADTGAAPPAS